MFASLSILLYTCRRHLQKVGKNKHIEALIKRVDPQIRKHEVVLFDDTEANVLEAQAKGYGAHFVPAAEVDEETGVARGGLTRAVWAAFLSSERPKPRGGCVVM